MLLHWAWPPAATNDHYALSTTLCHPFPAFVLGDPRDDRTSQASPPSLPRRRETRREIPQGTAVSIKVYLGLTGWEAGWQAYRLTGLQASGHGHSLKPPATLLRPGVHQRKAADNKISHCRRPFHHPFTHQTIERNLNRAQRIYQVGLPQADSWANGSCIVSYLPPIYPSQIITNQGQMQCEKGTTRHGISGHRELGLLRRAVIRGRSNEGNRPFAESEN
ncbi:hypothetical protein AOQ84DRAFT_61745 [Glonium stellatum]|uniref:Uncharacterized protein n=1 Tax=Glonium stellatum TaxID=574774 RepID=A0A8E2EYU3_9PEZI|nr:hypothetical protein AOQ84DRAFT_61745 [Glonium stellatum]